MERLSSFYDGDNPILKSIGIWGLKVYEEREMILMYIHLLLAALFPIYIGSHGSLRRPSSAEALRKSRNGEEEEDDDDEIPTESVVEGLTPSDAIMFPVLAGITLAALYFIIKWLKDPALLNKILTWYFSGLGIFGVGKLAGDSLNVLTTFFFPSVWSAGEETFYIDPQLSQQFTVELKEVGVQEHRRFLEGKSNPFPGPLSNVNFSASTTRKLWSLRGLLKNHWIFRGYLHGVFSLKRRVQLNDVVGLLIGASTIILYNTFGKAWWLTNLIGFGFCYGTLQLMTPTTFWTGSLVLGGLFIYDITMVFYTPLMVTVATSLDVPIKLVFPGPKRGGMLGLGDVVLPGIMMALALRFDLYLHYLRKQRSLTTPPKVIKAHYVEASSRWGERFWTRSSKSATASTAADGARFSKTYFYASVVGYVVGMLITLIVLNVYDHAQPALLYLVPGVLGALWGTALLRGEFELMWSYTEAESTEPVDPQTSGSKLAITEGTDGVGVFDFKEGKNDAKEIRHMPKKGRKDEHAHHVALFSLSEPKHRKS